MSDKEVVHTLRGDKQKQLGCLNGIFHIFDHRYLLGQCRHGHNHKRLLPGQSNNGETEVKNGKEKSSNVVTKEKSSLSPRNSFSSSSSSAAMSSLDCSKRVQTEVSSSSQSVVSEPSSYPFLHRKQQYLFMQSPDIRDVVKDSMTREPRVVSIRTVAKDERVGPAMKHVDSPRPSPHQKPIQYERMDSSLRELKETARFSCDGRESQYQMKSNKIKELPRLSLDSSRQGYISNSGNDPTSNKWSSSVVARLMGLEALTPSIESVLNSKSSRKEEELKHECTFVSPRVHKTQRAVKVSHVFTRIPLETAPWKQEGGGQGKRADPGSRSIYDEIEKQLTGHEFKTAGENLRAIKKILQAMQKTKKKLENKEHEARQITVGIRRSKDSNVRDRKANGKPLSTSNFPKGSETVSPKMQRSKNSINGPLSNSSRPKKQPGMQRPSFTEEKSTVDHAKHTLEQPSPVSVLDTFHTEETPSPVKKKVAAFNDDESLRFKEAQDQYSEFNKMKLENIKNLVHQIKLLSTNTDDATVNHRVTSPREGKTGDEKYVEEIIIASGCLRDLDRTTTIAQLHPIVSFINPELFHALEKTKSGTEITDDGYNKRFRRSRIRRKLVFDTVSDVLGHKLAMLGPLGPHKERVLNADKLLKEICSEIDGLQNKSEISVSDEDDKVTNIINADVNKRSQDWDEYYYQVPGLVLDIERLIFKDLISEVVNSQVTSLQDWPVRPYCRQLFPM